MDNEELNPLFSATEFTLSRADVEARLHQC